MRHHTHFRLVERAATFTLLLVTLPILVPSHNSASAQQRYRVVVSVISADRKEAVEGADVYFEIREAPNALPVRRSETTDTDGKAYRAFDYEYTRIFTIEVRHPDFYDSVQTHTVAGGKSGDVPVAFRLRRKDDRKVVVVDLTAEDNNLPVPEATVTLNGNTLTNIYTGTTKQNGRALLNVVHGDTYEVEITHPKFESVKATLRIKGYDDEQKDYSLAYSLKRKREVFEEKRTLRVKLQAKGADGVMAPLKYADVNLPGGVFKITDRYGVAEFTHSYAPGEEIRVEVEKEGYKPASASVTVMTIGSADSLVITLEKESPDLPNISGAWESDYKGNWNATSISQSGQTLSFTNEFGDTSPGVFVSKTKVKATKWEGGLGATVSEDGKTITWDNGTTWRRRQ